MSNKKVSQKQEIIYNIINSLLAGALVLLGSCADGEISQRGFIIALVAAGIVAITQFKNYWDAEAKDYKCTQLFSIIR